MDSKYFQLALDKIMELSVLVNERPTKVEFMEQWMADGFWIRWETSKYWSFDICCIWDGPRVDVIGVNVHQGKGNFTPHKGWHSNEAILSFWKNYNDSQPTAFESKEGDN